jgi:F0F1-type ATP synthase assembly protein I
VHFCTKSAAKLTPAEAEMATSPQPDKRDSSGRQTSTEGWYRMAGAGFEFIVAVMLFGGIGGALDRWLQTSPWLLIAGAGLGFFTGLYILLKMASGMFKD